MQSKHIIYRCIQFNLKLTIIKEKENTKNALNIVENAAFDIWQVKEGFKISIFDQQNVFLLLD